MTGIERIAGRWAVQAELGRGSMGRVVLLTEVAAVPSAEAMPLACKVLERPELATDLIEEVKLLRRLAHPAFVRPVRLIRAPAIPTGEPNPPPRLYALMERAEGQPLTPGSMPPGAPAVGAIARQLLVALDHLHRMGLVHGDLAPDNALWNGERLTILDLGAAGERGARAGRTTGVLAYCAPERLEGAGLEAAADLWSAGALLFGLAHGRHPWPGYPAARDATPDRRGLDAHALDGLFARLLALDPADRHPSASAALAELEAAMPELAAPPTVFVPPAFVEVGGAGGSGAIATACDVLLEATRAGRATSLTLRGVPGSGRSRALEVILERLAEEGVPGVEVPVREDDERAWIGDVLAVLGAVNPDAAGATMSTLVRAVAATAGPVVIAVDDLERAPNVRRAIERLARAIETIPDHYRGLVLVAAGLGSGAQTGAQGGVAETSGPVLEPPRWGADDVAESLRLRFPKRRIAARDAETLAVAARGNPGLLRAIVEEALRTGVMRVDSSQVVCDPGLSAMAPASLEAVAREAIERLSPESKQALGVLAWAERPAPVSLPAEVVRAGLVLQEPRGARLASEAIARAARPLVTQPVAARALATAYATTDAAASLAYRLELGDPVGAEAEALLDRPADRAAGATLLLLRALSRAGLRDAAIALRVGRLAEALGDPRLAAAAYDDARRLAAEVAERDAEARALLAIGRLEAAAARYPKALEAYRAALALLPAEATAGTLRVELQAAEARAAVLSGELEAAERSSDDALANPLASAPEALAGLLYTRALVDWYRGRLDDAEPRLERALVAARESGASADLAAIVTAQGLVAHRRGDLARASRAYTEAMRLGEAAHDEARVLTALQNLGVVQHERGDWTEALDTYREALARAEQLDARARIAQLAGNLGNLWRYLGDTERAETVLLRGLAIARADDNRHLHAVIANLLGDVASDRGDLPLAEARFREAIAVADDAQCQPEALEASLNLARLLLERFELKEARELAERVRTQASATAAHASRTSALTLLAALTRVEGGDGRALIDEALAKVEAHKNPDGRWPIYLEAALAGRDREDLAAAQTWSREVRKVLQAQLDAVPAAQREAFRARRDRRAAYRETAAFVAQPKEAASGQSGQGLGWGRLLEVHKRLAGEHNVQRLLEYILDSAILLTGAERGFLLLDDETHKEGLEVRVARNLDQENIRNKHLKISRGIARRVIASGEPIVTVDAMEDERYREQLSVVDLRLRSIMCLPMAFRGRVLGAIYLDNRFRASAFTGEDLRFMEAFADMAAVGLDSARLVESLEAQKRQTDAAKKEVESLNRRLEQDLERRTRELEDTRVQMITERRQLASDHRFDNIIGAAPGMRRLFQMIERLRNADVAVLIEGESGTGKELVARAIHFSGARRERPFVAVNCGAIPATLLESELFGHVRGAFTNATSDKKGLFEVAHTGTLFLDEIGEMPLEMQVKLLRVLQSGEIQKVGATKQVTVDVRIVAATNRKLEEEVGAGRFREDLFYRLSVIPLVVPPLRERREDIPLLVQHFIEQNRKAALGEVTGISKDALTLLGRYGWPGNVRQLETVLKNASVFCDSATLAPRDFESFPDIVGPMGGGATGTGGPDAKGQIALQGKTLADLERIAIVQALRDNKGNKKKTAELLGIDRRTLYNKLAAYGIAIEADLKVS